MRKGEITLRFLPMVPDIFLAQLEKNVHNKPISGFGFGLGVNIRNICIHGSRVRYKITRRKPTLSGCRYLANRGRFSAGLEKCRKNLEMLAMGQTTFSLVFDFA